MKTKEYKPVKVSLTGKQVPISEVVAKTSRGIVELYEKQIRAEMAGTPSQAAREYSEISKSTYMSLHKRLKKDFNLSYQAASKTMWVWKGIGLNGE
jgi:hypothetical protein